MKAVDTHSPAERALADPVPLLHCTIAGRPFAVPVALVERVMRWPLPEPSGYVPRGGEALAPIAPVAPMVPGAAVPGWIGVLASESLERPVIDACLRYAEQVTGETDRTRLLLLSVAGRAVALVVDAVLDVFTANAARMQPCVPSRLTRAFDASPACAAPAAARALRDWPVLATLDAVACGPGPAVQVLDVARLLSGSEHAALDAPGADLDRAVAER